MKGEVDSLVNFPIDTSLKTIAHSALSSQIDNNVTVSKHNEQTHVKTV